MPVTLRPIVKSTATTLRRDGRPLRRETWEAVTVDGEWAFERIEETGTPWVVVHWPRSDHANTATTRFGTLKAARQAVERGIDPWLPSVQHAAHGRGEHVRPDPYGCCDCIHERMFQ